MIPKETFFEVIELLRQQLNFDRRIGETITESFGVNKICSYQNNNAVLAIMKLLHVHFPRDKDGFCEIEHYCFILEFGKNDELMTPEELYDLLIDTKKE